jgi:hypothetical protein
MVPVRMIPLWVVRVVLGIAGIVLLPDAVTRVRMELPPAWLEAIAIPVELLIAACFLSIALFSGRKS